MRMLTA